MYLTFTFFFSFWGILHSLRNRDFGKNLNHNFHVLPSKYAARYSNGDLQRDNDTTVSGSG